MAAKPGITFERHQEIGADLKRIYDALLDYSVELSVAYPLSGDRGKPYRELRKAVHAMMNVRSDLEENYFREHPEKAHVHTYYPGQDPGPYVPGRNKK